MIRVASSGISGGSGRRQRSLGSQAGRAARAARKEAAMLEALSLAAGLSWASGLRLYLTIFVAGVFERMGLVHLPDTLAVLSSRSSNFSPTRSPPSIPSGTPFTR
jgi:hypothetical protein